MQRRQSAFEIYLRTGRRVAEPEELLETKFNPWHDPSDGRFTFANNGTRGGAGSGTGPAISRAPRIVRPAQPAPTKKPNLKQGFPKYLQSPTAALNRYRQEGNAGKTDAATWRGGGHMDSREVESRATNAMRMYNVHLARGMRPDEAAAWAANAEAESRGDYRARQPGGPGRGLFQWGDGYREKLFEKRYGHPVSQSTEKEQLDFRDWELANSEAAAAKKIARAKGAGNIAAAIALHYERPGQPDRDAADRANIAEAIHRRARRNR